MHEGMSTKNKHSLMMKSASAKDGMYHGEYREARIRSAETEEGMYYEDAQSDDEKVPSRRMA